MKKLSIIAAITLFALTSCKKDLMNQVTPTDNPTKVTQFKEIKANPNFDWKTSKQLAFSVSGLKTSVPIVKTLKVTSLDGKVSYLTILHQMDQNLQTNIILPVDTKEIMVNYGAITKKYSTLAGSIQFDFLPELTAE